MLAHVPEKIIQLAEAVCAAGGRALLVGGCVRDSLMNIAPKDWDVEVYGVAPQKLRVLLETFGRVDAVGEAFTVYKLGADLDVSLPRRERKSGRGHRGFVIEGDPAMSHEEAARRRDFTINAISQDPLDGKLLDPFDGQRDIKSKILRAISPETFIEDSLRVLRAAQFAARFDFTIEPETLRLCRTIDLTDLPAERVWGEMEKLLLRAARPSIGFNYLDALGATRQLFPEIENLKGVPQQFEYHPEGDVYVHTLLVTDYARTLVDDLTPAKRVTVMLAAICHDLGKPATTELVDGRWRSHGHDEAGVAPTISFLDRLNIHTLQGYDVRAQTVALVRDHLRPGEFYNRRDEISDAAIRRLAARCELDLLYRLSLADNMSRNVASVPPEKRFTPDAQEWFIRRVRELAVEERPPAPVMLGRHLIELGLAPSPRFKKILDAVYELQLEGKVSDLAEARDAARRLLAQAGEE